MSRNKHRPPSYYTLTGSGQKLVVQRGSAAHATASLPPPCSAASPTPPTCQARAGIGQLINYNALLIPAPETRRDGGKLGGSRWVPRHDVEGTRQRVSLSDEAGSQFVSYSYRSSSKSSIPPPLLLPPPSRADSPLLSSKNTPFRSYFLLRCSFVC